MDTTVSCPLSLSSSRVLGKCVDSTGSFATICLVETVGYLAKQCTHRTTEGMFWVTLNQIDNEFVLAGALSGGECRSNVSAPARPGSSILFHTWPYGTVELEGRMKEDSSVTMAKLSSLSLAMHVLLQQYTCKRPRRPRTDYSTHRLLCTATHVNTHWTHTYIHTHKHQRSE